MRKLASFVAVVLMLGLAFYLAKNKLAIKEYYARHYYMSVSDLNEWEQDLFFSRYHSIRDLSFAGAHFLNDWPDVDPYTTAFITYTPCDEMIYTDTDAIFWNKYAYFSTRSDFMNNRFLIYGFIAAAVIAVLLTFASSGEGWGGLLLIAFMIYMVFIPVIWPRSYPGDNPRWVESMLNQLKDQAPILEHHLRTAEYSGQRTPTAAGLKLEGIPIQENLPDKTTRLLPFGKDHRGWDGKLFVGEKKNFDIPHIRFRLNQFEYLYYVPDADARNILLLNPKMHFTWRGEKFWVGRYEDYIQLSRGIIWAYWSSLLVMLICIAYSIRKQWKIYRRHKVRSASEKTICSEEVPPQSDQKESKD